MTCHIWRRQMVSLLCGSLHVSSSHYSGWIPYHMYSRLMASLLCVSFHVSSNHHSGWMTCHIWSRQMASLLCGFFHVYSNHLSDWMPVTFGSGKWLPHWSITYHYFKFCCPLNSQNLWFSLQIAPLQSGSLQNLIWRYNWTQLTKSLKELFVFSWWKKKSRNLLIIDLYMSINVQCF